MAIWNEEHIKIVIGLFYCTPFSEGDDSNADGLNGLLAEIFDRSPGSIDTQWRNTQTLVRTPELKEERNLGVNWSVPIEKYRDSPQKIVEEARKLSDGIDQRLLSYFEPADSIDYSQYSSTCVIDDSGTWEDLDFVLFAMLWGKPWRGLLTFKAMEKDFGFLGARTGQAPLVLRDRLRSLYAVFFNIERDDKGLNEVRREDFPAKLPVSDRFKIKSQMDRDAYMSLSDPRLWSKVGEVCRRNRWIVNTLFS